MQNLHQLIEERDILQKRFRLAQCALDKVNVKIEKITELIPSKVLKQLGYDLPESDKKRQRINKEQHDAIVKIVDHAAEQLGSFTKSEVFDAVRQKYDNISHNILSRLFDSRKFRRVGRRAAEQGNPILYSIAQD